MTPSILRISLLLCLAVSTLLSGCTTSGSNTSWTKFSDAGAGFEALLPGTPTKEPIAVQREGITISGFAFKLTVEDSRATGGYTLSYVDLPPEAAETEASLDGMVVGAYNKIGIGQFLFKRLSTFAGHKSVEYQWKENGKTIVYTGRIFVASNRLYQAIAALPLTQHANGDADKFLQSFQMLRSVPANG